MSANIEAIRTDADAVYRAELALSALLYNLSFAAEYGHGSTAEAIDSVQTSRRQSGLAVIAAAVGNLVMAAAHEARAIAADAEADHMLKRAEGYADDLRTGLAAAMEHARDALGGAESLVARDDSSPAAEIHSRIAVQPDELSALAERVGEALRRVSGPRDPDELQIAAEHFTTLRHELEESSGRAQGIASDSLGYANSI